MFPGRAGRGENVFDQSGNKPPSEFGGNYSVWLEIYRVHFALQIAVLLCPTIKYTTTRHLNIDAHVITSNTVGDCLSLSRTGYFGLVTSPHPTSLGSLVVGRRNTRNTL